jgi:hypothetical protein
MTTTTVQALTNLGNITNGVTIVGESTPGTTGKFTIDSTGTGSVVLDHSPTLKDSNGNVSLTFAATASAVNYLTVVNGAAGGNVQVQAAGSDTDIPLGIRSKGNAEIFLSSAKTTTPIAWLTGTSFQHTTSFSISNTAASRTVTFPDLDGTMTLLGNTTTGSGSTIVLNTSPTFVTPTLGAATATSVNKVSITAPTTSSVLTIADGKTLTASNTLTFTGTDSSSVNFGSGGTVFYTSQLAAGMGLFLATPSSANLAATLTDETGSGAAVFATSPTLTSPALGTPTSGVLTNCTGLLVSGGGTGKTSVTTTPTASSWAGWDANSNLSTNNTLSGYTSIATAAGTTTFTVASPALTIFTGSTTQTVLLPVVSTLALGTTFTISNISSGVVTVQSSGANTIQAMQANSTLTVVSNATSGTGATVWTVLDYTAAASNQTGSGSIVRATSPTLVTPALGTPASGVLSSCTGYPSSAVVTSVTGTTPGAGQLGQIITASVSAGAITTTTYTDMTNISLTAGNWIVFGNLLTNPAGGTVQSYVAASCSTTSATLTAGRYTAITTSAAAGFPVGIPTTCSNISVSGATTVYLVGYVVYSVSTLTATGTISAVRIG